ncbi:MAG: hypothetical protein HY401_09980 [Elusimicrobia bacterium]|nr:hypothetical protein [Elusimicrobiota bacterium]
MKTALRAVGLLIQVAVLAPSVGAQSSLVELERKIDILTQEVEKLKLGEAAAEPVYESVYGFAPAAAKVYHVNRGVSIGGYGEMTVQDFDSKREDGKASGKLREADFLRAVIYVGHKFTDKILFNSEIEFEHASTAGGSAPRGEVSLEFGYLDFMFRKEANLRAGLLLLPVGLTNELHEPIVFHGSLRPAVERNFIPTTWRENGVGLFGTLGPIEYRSYAVAGLQAVKDATPGVKGFSASTGLKDGRSKGAKTTAEDLAWAARADYKGVPGVVLGASVYTGNSGQSMANSSGVVDGSITLWETHASWNYQGLELKGLYGVGSIGDAAKINAMNGLAGNKSIGERMFGGYAEAAFDVLSLCRSKQYLAPFARYERYDTQSEVPAGFSKDPANSRAEFTYGLTYKPHPNTVIKADYQNLKNQAKTGVDQFNLAIGYLF